MLGKGAGFKIDRRDYTQVILQVVTGKTINNGEFVMLKISDNTILAWEAGIANLATYEFLGVAQGPSVTGDGTANKKMLVQVNGGVYESFATGGSAGDAGKVVTILTKTTVAIAGAYDQIGIVTPELDVYIAPWYLANGVEDIEIIVANLNAGAVVAADEFKYELQEACDLVEGFGYIQRALDGSAASNFTVTCGGDALVGSGTLDFLAADSLGDRKELAFTTNTRRAAKDIVKFVSGGTVHVAGSHSIGIVVRKYRTLK